MKKNKALLVIDMQKGSFTEKTPRFDTSEVVKRINLLTQKFREINQPVIHIQHDGTKAGEFIKDTTDWEILDSIVTNQRDLFIDKYANDAFYESQLQTELTKFNVNELVITGCATDFCVESTIQSALIKNYSIVIVKDGHTTGDRPHLKAEKIIEHYNYIWQNMIPTRGKIEVKILEKILNNI